MELRGNASTENSPSSSLVSLSLSLSFVDFCTNNSPHAFFFSAARTSPSFGELSRGTLYIPAFCLARRIKGTPLPDSVGRPANFIMYVLPTTGHLCWKKMVKSAGYSSDQRMRAKMIGADNCTFAALWR